MAGVWALVDTDRLKAAIAARLDEELADRIVNHMAAEIASDVKQILSVKERREALRHLARTHAHGFDHESGRCEMTSLESRLKALLYADSGAAETDYPKPVAPPPPLPELTADQVAAMDECAEIPETGIGPYERRVSCATCGVSFIRQLWMVLHSERNGFATYCSRTCYLGRTKKVAPELTVERLRALLHYDAESGVFTRLVSTSQNGQAGAIAGTSGPRGYRNISIDGRNYQEHRVAWFYAHGAWPTHQIDHLNGNPEDNRLSNLRDVPPYVNQMNKRGPYRNNTTGFLGVTRDGNRFAARIQSRGVLRRLGVFASAEEAHAAYLAAKRDRDAGADMSSFIDIAKTEMHQQFSAHGWGNTAAAELAEIHCGVANV